MVTRAMPRKAAGIMLVVRHVLTGVTVLALSTRAFAASLTLAWDPVAGPGVAGYGLHQRSAGDSHITTTDVGSVTSATIGNLSEGATYYFAVTAYSASGVSSSYSNEVVVTVPYTAPVASLTTTPAVEFYNARLDHYFVTAIPGEIAALDAGTIPGWARTRLAFPVWRTVADAPDGASPVCRIQIPPGDGNSHFYSASPRECGEARVRFLHFVYEGDEVMAVRLPDPATGGCLSDSAPVYRLWNNRSDVNHRYTTDLATRQTMIERGYVPEGYGPQGVAFCAPL
jgi:hypothetical protein